MTQLETYTRDSDGKRFEAIQRAGFGLCTAPNEPDKYESLYQLIPIEENPMPEILPGDFIISTSESVYLLETYKFSNGRVYYCGSRLKHYRNGKLLWEAKKKDE